MDRTITVTINVDNSVIIEALGYTGTSCADITRILGDALHGEIKEIEYKPEYYNRLPSTNTNKLRI